VRQTVLVGAVLIGLVAAMSGVIWGAQAAIAAGIFGVLAVAIQLAALALVEPVKKGPIKALIKRWGVGMGLRALGVVAIAVAVGLDRTYFPPLATAMGFLGVLLPLLFFEVRLLR
jgi:hypothetical protein